MISSVEKVNYYKETLRTILSNEELEAVQHDHNSLIDFGYEYVELGDFDRAYDLFMINIKMCGFSPDVLNGLAITLLELKDIEAAYKVMQKTLHMYPDDAITLANMAGIYWELKNYEKAIFYYNKSIQQDSSLIDTHFNLINLYYEQGNVFMSYIRCLQLLKIFPHNEDGQKLCNEILMDMAISFY